MSNASAVRFENVDAIFGSKTSKALCLLVAGEVRDAILEKTGALVAVHGASLFLDYLIASF